MADMKNIEAENASVTTAWSETDVTIAKFKYVWTINNFRLLWDEMGKKLESPTFSVFENDNEIKWRLMINAKIMEGAYKGYVSLYLKLISTSDNKSVNAKHMFYILNAKKEQVNHMGPTKLHEFVAKNPAAHSWGCGEFIKWNFLFDEANRLLPNGKLTVVCEGSVIGKSINTSGQIHVTKLKVPECQLSDNLGLLLDQGKHSDVIISVCDQEFKAHKAIVASRSSVFAAMFEREMEESKHNKVEITDMDAEVFKEMLRYIYTGKVLNIEKIAVGLLAAADKYALERLKVMCEEFLCRELSTENAVEILLLADLHSASQLTKHAVNFIVLHMDDVKKTSGWKSMIKSMPQFAEEIFFFVSESFSRMSVNDPPNDTDIRGDCRRSRSDTL